MNKLKRFLLNLQFIFMPRYWIMNYQYSSKWDKYLNQLIEENNFTSIAESSIMLGNQEIWVLNYPYACMRPIDWNNLPIVANFRPSRLTIQKAYKKYLKDITQQGDLCDKWFKK